MNKRVTKCDACQHFEICALKEEFKKTESELPEMISNFEVLLNCLNFSSKPVIRGPFERGI